MTSVTTLSSASKCSPLVVMTLWVAVLHLQCPIRSSSR